MFARTYFNTSRAKGAKRSARLAQSPELDAGPPSAARGVVAVEYVVIVGSLALLAIPAALAVGKALVESFGVTREMLFFPIP